MTDGRPGAARGATAAPPDGRRPASTDDEPKPLGQEAPEVIEDASRIGARRLNRPAMGDAITALIGGMSVSFGAVAMAWATASLGGEPAPSAAHLVGALVFPVGFLILLVGKSELFTENFFLPVTAVLERRGSVGQLALLWAVSLGANLVGALIFAFLISRHAVLDHSPAQVLIDLATHNVEAPFETAFVQAVFAGWLMTMLTWLMVAAEGFGPRLFIIWVLGTLIVLGRFNHVVISSAEAFMALFLGAPFSPAEWVRGNFVPALLGNIVGGIVFVTLLSRVQARHHDPQS